MIRRPSLFTILFVKAPKVPVPIVIPMLSVGLWLLTALAGLVLMCLPERAVRRRGKGEVALSSRRLGRQLIRVANVMWWSGSFVLCDVHVPTEGVRVWVGMI